MIVAESVVFNGADEVLYFRRMMDISLNEVYSLIILFLAILQATCDGLKTEEVRSQNFSFYYFLFTFRTKGSLCTQKSGIGPKL